MKGNKPDFHLAKKADEAKVHCCSLFLSKYTTTSWMNWGRPTARRRYRVEHSNR
jgi:hypothetical protein